ncbi:MAG: carboxypeptidase regulatory-like domain-containing protein [Anaerolineae bacterium]|nr:MAG: carboxypeptidase regulatory-like domain-containing protein [Anaerolineae bacterium]
MPGANIDVRLSNGTPVTAVTSGADGAYVVHNLAAQAYQVEVSGPSGYIALPGTNPANVVVLANQTVMHDFPLILLPPTPTPTPTATPNTATVQRQVAAGLDDTHQRVTSGYNDLAAPTVRLGQASGYQLLSGLRFSNVALPSHVRIIDARLEVNRTYHAGADPVGSPYAVAQDNAQLPNAAAAECPHDAGIHSMGGQQQRAIGLAHVTQPGRGGAGSCRSGGLAAGQRLGPALGQRQRQHRLCRNRQLRWESAQRGACVSIMRFVYRPISTGCGVAINDVQLVAAHWGLTSGSPGWHPVYDLVPNGVIDAADIAAAASAWGQWGC